MREDTLIIRFLKRVWYLIEYWWTRFVDYKYKKSIFSILLKWFSISLIAELAKVGADLIFDDVYEIIKINFGVNWELFARIIIDGILGGFTIGYHWVSIIIKVYLITLFAILEHKKINNGNVGRQFILKNILFWKWNWRVVFNVDIELNLIKVVYQNSNENWQLSNKWFKEINETYRLNKNKFIKELHVESKLEKKLFEQIVNEHIKVSEYTESFNTCRKALTKLRSKLNELNILIEDNRDPLIISDKSDLFLDYQRVIDTTITIDQHLNEISVLSQVRSNQDIRIEQVYFPISSYELRDYIESSNFDLIKLSTSDKKNNISKIFDAFSPILLSIQDLNETIEDLNNKKDEIIRNHFIVHAAAGIGKTYFAAHIYSSLKKDGHFPLFITASAFSGNHSSLSHAFQKVFKYSEATSIISFFSKLNEFAKKKKKRVIIIIDGMNETTYNLSGFSPIWGDGIENLTEDISKYEYLTFLATCRTSYLENSIERNFSLDCSHKLSGFEAFETRKKAIEQYFKHYKIESNVINRNNSRLFSTPLILRIYCISKNGDRAGNVKVRLNHSSYEETLFKFIEEECIDLANKLDRPSARPIFNGIFRSSEKFIQEISGSLNYNTFLELTQGKSIDEIIKSTSIGYKFLESELLFMKDFQPYFKGEKVVHTFQNVGGYILAQFLYNKYNKPSDFVKSDEFSKLLSGIKKNRADGSLNNNAHQLGLDIMLFMVYRYSKSKDPKYTDDLLDYTQDPLVLEYSWRFVSDYSGNTASTRLERKLKELVTNLNLWDGLLENNIEQYIDTDFPLNFLYIKDFLLEVNPFLIELTWVKNIYENSSIFQDFLKEDFSTFDSNQLNIALELTIWLLESTIHEIRDSASKNLLEFGCNNPEFILLKVEKYSKVKRLYIFERLTGIAYGICLRKQNDQSFVNNQLKPLANTVYNLQFKPEPAEPSYHYIVIDSFKHIIDLAIYLKVFELPVQELARLKQYKFNASAVWDDISDDDRNKVSLKWSSHPDPDPFSGDFVTYTIPRLLDINNEGHLDAVAHIFKRLIDSGYEQKVYKDFPEGIEQDFYFGSSKSDIKGKVDRLGKKYSWNAFFEYAGYLLNLGELPVFYDGEKDSSVTSFYDRLSDVEIEVSNPQKKYLNKKLFSEKLLKDKTDSQEWPYKEKFKSLDEVFNYQFDSNDYTLLYGYFEEGEKSKFSYDVRSFLLVTSFLVKKEDLLGKEDQILNKTLNWDFDLHSNNSIDNTYFGELYWADSIPEIKRNRESIVYYKPNGKDKSLIKNKLSGFEGEETKEIIKKGIELDTVQVQVPIEVEPALVEYSWETNSKVYPALRGNIPSPNIGKHLNLKADAENFQILDKNNKRAFVSVEFEEEGILRQNSDYIRTDLLRKYLDDKDLVLMYQIKQHTFDRKAGDGSGDFRGMQFKIKEL
ncbi:hypothetical protein LPB03_05015 [Polaribacter vadi]|uniref:Uncharacterized protein n=1 Tax=Polaribacter vadi TaxID=1774273 RepID=A0A1B8TXN5_9FLAO|nr:hypothetical protein [Polaribacter vadi]AOW16866.1 hypothetical protein LPB03_05015 [Polaribacter vadi]OBY64225.1 hypothetical protein LPB3_07480 [Polaribacter vadi]